MLWNCLFDCNRRWARSVIGDDSKVAVIFANSVWNYRTTGHETAMSVSISKRAMTSRKHSQDGSACSRSADGWCYNALHLAARVWIQVSFASIRARYKLPYFILGWILYKYQIPIYERNYWETKLNSTASRIYYGWSPRLRHDFCSTEIVSKKRWPSVVDSGSWS